VTQQTAGAGASAVFIHLRGDEMNVGKALEQIKALKHGYDVDDETLISYIDTAEHMILTDIVCGREGDDEVTEQYHGCDLDDGRDTELFAPKPFEQIYAQYAATQIDMIAEDGERYLNDLAVFRDTYLELKRYWWRTHRQKNNYRYF
jgi:hypothetical protein